MKLINYILDEKKQRNFENIKNEMIKHMLEIKPGYKFGLKLTNKLTSKSWISSTNNIDQREKHLKTLLKSREKWNGPWIDTFSSLTEQQIENDSVRFDRFEDIGNISIVDIINSNFSETIAKDIKPLFIEIVRIFALEVNLKDKNKFRDLIEEYFDQKKNSYNLNELIDKLDLEIE